jgi:hypothetical protein
VDGKKSRCFASSCEEVPTENSICGSSLGTFSFAQSPISADKKVGVRSTGVHSFADLGFLGFATMIWDLCESSNVNLMVSHGHADWDGIWQIPSACTFSRVRCFGA